MDYKDMVEETPAFTLFRMFIRQFMCVRLFTYVQCDPLTTFLSLQWIPDVSCVRSDIAPSNYRQ